jgi:hypothetical protein
VAFSLGYQMNEQVTIERAPFAAMVNVFPSIKANSLYHLANKSESVIAFGNLKEVEYRLKLDVAFRFISSVKLWSAGLAWNHALQATIGMKPVFAGHEFFIAGERGADWDKSWFKPDEWPSHLVEGLKEFETNVQAEREKLLDEKQKKSGFAWYGRILRPNQLNAEELFDENSNAVLVIKADSLLTPWKSFLSELGARYA